MLTFDPLQRISALNALEHEYLKEEKTPDTERNTRESVAVP